MARNHDLRIDVDLSLSAASCTPSADGIHFNIVNSTSVNLEQNRFDNNLSVNSAESRVMTTQSDGRAVSPVDNMSANLVDSDGRDLAWAVGTNSNDDRAVRADNELNSNAAESRSAENELDGEPARTGLQVNDTADQNGEESETSDDNNERERVFDVQRLKNLRALDANLDFGELDDRRAAAATASSSRATFSGVTPQFGSAFWTAHRPASRTRRSHLKQTCTNGVDRHSAASRRADTDGAAACSHASEPSSVTDDFIDESCESSSVSAASEDAAQSESSNDDAHVAAGVAAAADVASPQPLSSTLCNCGWRRSNSCAACTTNGRHSSRKRPRRRSGAGVPSEDAESDADDEGERDAEPDAEVAGPAACEQGRPIDQLDSRAATRQNDLNSSANGVTTAMQNDLSDTRPVTSTLELAGASTRPKALGRRPAPAAAASIATETDECDNNVMSPSQLMDALRSVTDSGDLPGSSTPHSPAPSHMRHTPTQSNRSNCNCTCDCSSHPLNVTGRDLQANFTNGHVCSSSAEQSSAGMRVSSARHERRAAFACALHGTSGSDTPSSRLESTASSSGNRLASVTDSSNSTVQNGQNQSSQVDADPVSGLESNLERERRSDSKLQNPITSTVSEKVLIWSEYEAYISQVKQIGASACGPTAVINVLKSFDLLEFCDDKRRVEAYVRTRRRAERGNLVEYLRSRSRAGTTAQHLVAGVRRLTRGRVEARFFATFPERRFALSAWLASWIQRGATPLATLNLQRAVPPGYTVPDAWHHQMVFGVGPKGVYLTNPLETVPETVIRQQLASDSVLLVRKADVVARWHDRAPDCDLSDLLDTPYMESDADVCADSSEDTDADTDCEEPATVNGDESETENSHALEPEVSEGDGRREEHEESNATRYKTQPAARAGASTGKSGVSGRRVDPRWREMNVLGQVVHTLRTSHSPGFAGFQPECAHHVCIPAAYRAGITLFVRADNAEALEALRNEPELPLLSDSQAPVL